ncbi:hypothetical protein HGB24_03520 [Candidatus Saccharibacteria bacterium]|nr:hypothetical protein [Candidatus Saccharibacteria bacterium]
MENINHKSSTTNRSDNRPNNFYVSPNVIDLKAARETMIAEGVKNGSVIDLRNPVERQFNGNRIVSDIIPTQRPERIPTEPSSPEQESHNNDSVLGLMGEASLKLIMAGSIMAHETVKSASTIYDKSANLASKGVDMAGNSMNLAYIKLNESFGSMYENLTLDKSKERAKKTGIIALKALGFVFSSNIREDFYDYLDMKAKKATAKVTNGIRNKFKGQESK